MTRPEQPWSEAETESLYAMRRDNMQLAAIAAVLGRSIGSVTGKLYAERRGLAARAEMHTVTNVAAPEALADLDRRQNLKPRDLTAYLCGDPLPGYSALDRGRP